jgi:hypothetical protein
LFFFIPSEAFNPEPFLFLAFFEGGVSVSTLEFGDQSLLRFGQTIGHDILNFDVGLLSPDIREDLSPVLIDPRSKAQEPRMAGGFVAVEAGEETANAVSTLRRDYPRSRVQRDRPNIRCQHLTGISSTR